MKNLLPIFLQKLNFQILAPIVILFCVVASSSIFIIIELQERLDDIENQSLTNNKINQAIFEFDQIRSSIKSELLAYLLTSDRALRGTLERLEERRKKIQPQFFEALKVRPDFQDDFRKLELTYEKTLNLRRRILAAVESKDIKKAIGYFNSYSVINEINSARMADLRTRLETEAAINREETEEFYNWLRIFMVIIILFGTTVIIYSFHYYRKNLIVPIQKLTEGLNKIKVGHFPKIEQERSSSVEVRNIIEDFNETTANLKNIKEELVAANDNALNLARIKSDFLANMSHEIRTPLNSIIGMSELLKDFDHTEKVSDYISTITSSGNLLLNIVNDILDLSKLETGKIQLDPSLCDIHEFAKSTTSTFTHLFAEKSINFSMHLSSDCPEYIIADYKRLEQIILNLLGNSYKFTPSGSVSLSIRRHPSEEDKKIIFEVTDTGIGISEDIKDQLFTRFTQADSSITKQYGGTGLGLSIVKELVELMKGEIKVESSPGKGSTFTIIVPLVEATEEEVETLQTEIERPSPEQKIVKQSGHILLVDDSKENRKIARLFLEGLPITIDEAQNGVEALAAFEKNDYDLIIMDMQMPVLDGHSATMKIREIENVQSLKKTPVIALTAFVMKNEIEKCISAGCDTHIAKPINRNLLIKTVVEFLNT